MRVLVLWERDNERDYACNLAKVLDVIGGSLAAEAEVDKNGAITHTMHGRALPKMEITAAPIRTAMRMGVNPAPEPEPEPAPPPPVTDPSVWLLQARIRDADQVPRRPGPGQSGLDASGPGVPKQMHELTSEPNADGSNG